MGEAQSLCTVLGQEISVCDLPCVRRKLNPNTPHPCFCSLVKSSCQRCSCFGSGVQVKVAVTYGGSPAAHETPHRLSRPVALFTRECGVVTLYLLRVGAQVGAELVGSAHTLL